MQNQDFERERPGRQRENDSDWDWYYYEYRYLPYGYRSNPYSNDWTEGPYSGVGPRGYRRTDDRIKDDVNDRLTWHGYLDATDIQVDVNDGVVTLSGTVNTRREKRMAEDAAESVSGVEDVNNQLSIRQSNRYFGEGSINRQIRVGMEVISRDGENIGEVKEVRSNDFLVDRSMARDVYIPFSACQTANGQIRVNVHADEVDNQGWDMPDLLETDTSSRSQKKR